MRFLDANIFIYAFYKPIGSLDSYQKEMKEKAKDIIRRVNQGKEEVVTTVVHLSEISNILKRSMSLEDLFTVLITLYSLDNVKILDVTKEDYLGAVELMEDLRLDPNDTLAVQAMRMEGVKEIYSFDRGFDEVENIERVV
ncbi:MAG: type II toxin-antitoxin system VapC family toxin [Candidatus Hydrothermarchaeota archaeon]